MTRALVLAGFAPSLINFRGSLLAAMVQALGADQESEQI